MHRPAAAPKHRPAARARLRLRRPAAAIEQEPEEDPHQWLRKFEAGEEVKGKDLSPGVFKKGLKIIAEKGVYYGQEAAVAVVIDHEEVDGADRELVCTLSGTKNEELLKIATASQPFTVRMHLCGDDCMQNRVNPNLVHVSKVKKLLVGIPTWEENLVVNEEMEALRRDQEQWQGREKEKDKKKKSSSSSSSSGRKKKKKKKKKKSKKEEDKKKGGVEGDKQSPAASKDKPKKLGSRSYAKKDLEAIYGGTGMDPDQKKRKRIARRVKRALRKGKTTSSTSGSSSGSSLEEEKEEILLEDRNKVHRIAQLCPGLLSSLGIEAMRPFLLQLGSTGWETEGSQIPPLLSLYYRAYMCNRLSGGVQREFATLAWLADLMVQGRIAEALDTAIQRMKAIELVSKGDSWQSSQKLELAPPGEASMTQRSERQVAQKESKLDRDVKGGNSNFEKGKGKQKDRTGLEEEDLPKPGERRGKDEARREEDGGLLSWGDHSKSKERMSRKEEIPLFSGGCQPRRVPKKDHSRARKGRTQVQRLMRRKVVKKKDSPDQENVKRRRLAGQVQEAADDQRFYFVTQAATCVQNSPVQGPTGPNPGPADRPGPGRATSVEKLVGSVPLAEVVELGCKHYVPNFEDYLLEPEDQQQVVKPPKVMVPPDQWFTFCKNLLDKGVFDKVHESDIYQVQGKPLLNGLFGVSKNEFEGPWEVMRIIMNLVPLNGVVRSFEGDVSTLPSLAGLNPLHLELDEGLVVSSEDVRCFFYIFKVPLSWQRLMAFNRPLPPELGGQRPGKWYPCSAVLPMGFKNSVALAQHVHRCIVNRSLKVVSSTGLEAEMRKDKSFSCANPFHRIYLDNFDQLCKVSRQAADTLEGQVSSLVAGLREEYAMLGVPRHPKKSVVARSKAEVQGAMIDGIQGVAYPKVEKVLKYAHLTRLLLQSPDCAQKQLQIVGGGLVYIAMFRRPTLGSLNHIWQFILRFEGLPPVVRLPIPDEVKMELSRFLGLIPLCYMDFRSDISSCVTASDASTTGGGVTASTQLTPFRVLASQCPARGDVIEPDDVARVLTVGLFDGIAALRVAADVLQWNVVGHISVEKSPEAARVVESRFPTTEIVSDVKDIDLAMVKTWVSKYPQVSLVMLGAGPPCQGVSALNAARKGALRDERSCLFSHVPRVRSLLQQCFPWAQVRSLMENVESMSEEDEGIMSDAFGSCPFFVDASGVSLARRPRLYWIDWELLEAPDCVQKVGSRAVGQLFLYVQRWLLNFSWKQDGAK
eukprot:Skav213443  [mRNA]  locus=scaffold837:212799:217106:- [translate_table: standard]